MQKYVKINFEALIRKLTYVTTQFKDNGRLSLISQHLKKI